jgi:hypothetical protein
MELEDWMVADAADEVYIYGRQNATRVRLDADAVTPAVYAALQAKIADGRGSYFLAGVQPQFDLMEAMARG